MLGFILILIFIALNFLDYTLTCKIIKLGGKEINPVIKIFGIIPVKVVVFIFLLLFYNFIDWRVFAIPDVIFAGVCIWNFIQLKKQV